MIRPGPSIVVPILLTVLSACAGRPHARVLAEQDPDGSQVRISDAAFTRKITRGLQRLAATDGAVDVSLLQGQLTRQGVPELAVPLASPHSTGPHSTGEARSGPDVYARTLPGVVTISKRYLCGKCDKWHVQSASGFAIADGIVVTNHHVVESGESGVMAAFDHRGISFPIDEVLVADAEADLAVLRLGGDGPFPAPLPVTDDVRLGADVFVLSHPDRHYFYFSRGILARKITSSRSGREQFEITADFVRGSSGGPVVDARGHVIGVVVATDSVYYDASKDTNLQMVFKKVVPARQLLDLLGR